MRYVIHFSIVSSIVVALMLSLAAAVPQYAHAIYTEGTTATEQKTKVAEPTLMKATTKKQDVSVAQLIELLISLDIIPEEKAAQARAVLQEEGYAAATTVCPSVYFKYNLYLGLSDTVTGDEVTKLQEWLVTMPEVYPEGLITGYFGPATEQAVQRYQSTNGIVSSGAPETTGYGVVGPKTRAKINACTAGTTHSASKDVAKETKDAKKDVKDKEQDTTTDVGFTNPVSEIVAAADEGNGKVYWETDGYSKKGYKVVWSRESGPTYPTRSTDRYRYYSSSDADHSSLDAFDGAGTYYVRVCEYLGGSCGVYSNEATITLHK